MCVKLRGVWGDLDVGSLLHTSTYASKGTDSERLFTDIIDAFFLGANHWDFA